MAISKKKLAERSDRLNAILPILHRLYPNPLTALTYSNPFELLIATILSAQCTDERVNMVTPALFKCFPTVASFANAKQSDIETLIFSTGFYRNKAKSIIGAAIAIRDHHAGEIPRTLAELVKIPGAGRKTASVVLGSAYGIAEGIVVDTHVTRLSQRLALTTETDPVKIERDLIAITPQSEWIPISHLFILHGRATCKARTPICYECPLASSCPSADRFEKERAKRS